MERDIKVTINSWSSSCHGCWYLTSDSDGSVVCDIFHRYILNTDNNRLAECIEAELEGG